ncbi:Uncharacterised protein [Vibrio cholerae]|uniref:Uncharacterized protein n=1 Tax=Vibrio cholerae TaxID=666 RepID=A0A655ZLL8_VIBCL|nr:Uncharacterised protein [Vibrio cholerae]CSB81750.1 Uncharacterised protein [Vibrio cholerae]CSC33338.1 Uncharacterised protein [Vibrio cholerae]CSC73526.1 Uncharacterised protein [Vibrio cholerae]CSC76191.1 Uncharacterised protein [Vibrio cholerae]
MNPIAIRVLGMLTSRLVYGQFRTTNRDIDTKTIRIHRVNKLMTKAFLLVVTHQRTTNNTDVIRFVVDVFGLIKRLLELGQFHGQLIGTVTT